MCTAYQVHYLECGDYSAIMFDSCDNYKSANKCEEREEIKSSSKPAKIKTANASCPQHQ